MKSTQGNAKGWEKSTSIILYCFICWGLFAVGFLTFGPEGRGTVVFLAVWFVVTLPMSGVVLASGVLLPKYEWITLVLVFVAPFANALILLPVLRILRRIRRDNTIVSLDLHGSEREM